MSCASTKDLTIGKSIFRSTIQTNLDGTASVDGLITDIESNKPIQGVDVLVEGEQSYFSKTDSTGYYSINNVLPGKYYIRTYIIHYDPVATDTLILQQNNRINLDFQLKYTPLIIRY